MHEIRDVLAKMKCQETTNYKRKFCVPTELKGTIEPTWRKKMMKWMYSVIECSSGPRETVAVAAYFIDVFVSKGMVRSKGTFQLVATTALHLSIKLFDSSLVKLDSLVRLCRGLFTAEDVVKMERRMIFSLGWHLHPPTPSCFLVQFFSLFPSNLSNSTREKIKASAETTIQKAICENSFMNCRSSMIAFAAIMISVEQLHDVELPIWQRQCFVMNMATCAKIKASSSELHRIIAELKGEQSVQSSKNKTIRDIATIPKGRCALDTQDAMADVRTRSVLVA